MRPCCGSRPCRRGVGCLALFHKLNLPTIATLTTSTFDRRPFLNGNSETCTFNNPAAGDHFVMIRGFAAYSGVTLVGHFP
jgi:hypothetical protein